MARFLDESPEYQPEDGEALANLEEDYEEQIPEEEQPAEPEEIQEAEDAIPEKYQGKTSQMLYVCIKKLKSF